VDVPSSQFGTARYVDPGKWQIVGTFDEQVLRETARLAEGEEKQIVLAFKPTKKKLALSTLGQEGAAAPKPSDAARSNQQSTSPQRTWGWIGLGVGATGLAVGTVAGLVVASRYGELKEDCPGGQCEPEDQSRVSSYDRWQTISTVGFIVGGVGAAVGVTLLLTSPQQESKPSVSLWMGPATMSVRGAF
jgi:hypothetical protein